MKYLVKNQTTSLGAVKILFACVLVGSIAACSTTVDLSDQPPPPPVNIPAYTLGIGDEIDVNVWKSPELSARALVRPDGKISLPLAGDIQAAGATPEELASQIVEKLTQYVRNPQVTVVVASPVSAQYFHRVRVTGAINQPLSVPYAEGMTVLDLVLAAGGTSDFARPNSARLYRMVNGNLEAFPIRLSDILNKGNLETNYMLSPGDIITVPERIF